VRGSQCGRQGDRGQERIPLEQRRSFSLGTAVVSAEAPEFEITRHVKEMNFLSAHRSSSPTWSGMQSVSAMCRNGVAGSSGWAAPAVTADNVAMAVFAQVVEVLAGHHAAVADEHDALEPEALFEITQHVGHRLGIAPVARERTGQSFGTKLSRAMAPVSASSRPQMPRVASTFKSVGLQWNPFAIPWRAWPRSSVADRASTSIIRSACPNSDNDAG
jgi:hypothetical protein